MYPKHDAALNPKNKPIIVPGAGRDLKTFDHSHTHTRTHARTLTHVTHSHMSHAHRSVGLSLK